MASCSYDGYAFVYEALVGFFVGGEVVIFKEGAEDCFSAFFLGYGSGSHFVDSGADFLGIRQG